MITKERLKELIEQGATVYSKYYSYKLDSESLGDRITYGVFDNEEYLKTDSFIATLKNIYEHKADAEWDLEFGNVEKRIKFVKPKPFREVESVRNQTVYDAHGIEIHIGENNIFIWTGVLFEKPFTEENYKEACRLIKKLFIGEE